MVHSFKESKPCKDCNKWYPYYIMQFDHLEKKEFLISEWVRQSLDYEILFQEIEKCDLICANCHFARTFLRSQKSDTELNFRDIVFKVLEKLPLFTAYLNNQQKKDT